MGNGPHYYGECKPPRYSVPTKLELAKEQRNIALQNLTSAARRLTEASNAYNEAKAAEHAACTCCPQHGGK